MNAKIILAVSLAALALPMAACDDPDSLTGRGTKYGSSGDPAAGGDQAAAEALQCTDKPQGRVYKQFDGSDLTGDRANENVGVNRARIKPYAVMAGEYTRVLGAAPPSLAKAASSFDEPPDRWFEEASHSGVSLNAIFDISFEGCTTYVQGQGNLAAAPTADTAKDFCSTMMRKAWSRTASPEEVDGCVQLATDKLSQETNVQRRWAYVCASILSSSNFLTF